MQINSRKKNGNINISSKKIPFFLTGVVLLCLFSFWLGSVLYESGAHTSLKLLLQGRYEELPDGTIKDTFKEIYGLLKSEAVAYTGNNLPTLYLDIPFENLQIIQQKRDEALRTGILLASDEDYVTASIRYNDSVPMDVELRLKGDWTDHLEGDKWSYRIHINEDAAVEGMVRFSIQAPETRNFLYEWAYHQNLLQEGLLAPRYFFVNVIQNGENKGIYAVEESFYTELIESEKRRSGVILRFNEDDMWQNWSTFFSVGKEDMRTAANASGSFMQAEYESAAISSFGQGKILASPLLLAEYRAAQSMLRNYQSGSLKASEVFDMEQMGRFMAITELWGAGHALAWHNLRFYYNPVTNLFEPVAFDGIPMVEPYVSVDFAVDDFDTSLLDDPELRETYYTYIQEYLDPDYIHKLEHSLEVQGNVYASSLSVEYKADTEISWQGLLDHQVYLAQQNDPERYVEVKAETDPAEGIRVNIRNVYFTPLIMNCVEFRNSAGEVLLSMDLDKEITQTAPKSDEEQTVLLQSEQVLEEVQDTKVVIFFAFSTPDGTQHFWKEAVR